MLIDFFQELNKKHFQEELPLPTLSWNSKLRTTAGRFSPGSRGFLKREAKIEIAAYLRELPDGKMHIQDTILHEMIHYYLWHKKRPYGHTPEFHAILKKVGAKRYNPVPKESPVKHWYECSYCRTKVPARRKLGRVACAACCKKYYGGKFSEKFLLRLSQAPVVIATAASAPPQLPKLEEAVLPPSEIISRLEQLKALIQRARH